MPLGFLHNALSGLDQLTLRKPGLLPAAMTGAGPAMAGRAALGAGGGYLAGSLFGGMPDVDQDKAKRRWAIAGGAIGAASSIPDMAAVTQTGHSLTNGTFAKTAHEHSYVGVAIHGRLRQAALDLARHIEKKDLAKHGLEKRPHVTVLYGLHTHDARKVRQHVQKHAPLKLHFGGLSLFQRPKYDVLKADVTGRGLHALHHKLKDNLPNSDAHPAYMPHLTIAYLKKGTGHKYLHHGHLKGRRYVSGKVEFNTPDNQKTHLSLAKAAADLRSQLVTRSNMTKTAELPYQGTYPEPEPWNPSTSFPAQVGQPAISVNIAANSLLNNPSLTPPEKATAFQVLANASEGQSQGFLRAPDLLRAAVDTGLGYMAGNFVGRVFGTMFGISRPAQRNFGRVGAALGGVGGLLG
jgi:2'-5' RNA ligase